MINGLCRKPDLTWGTEIRISTDIISGCHSEGGSLRERYKMMISGCKPMKNANPVSGSAQSLCDVLDFPGLSLQRGCHSGGGNGLPESVDKMIISLERIFQHRRFLQSRLLPVKFLRLSQYRRPARAGMPGGASQGTVAQQTRAWH